MNLYILYKVTDWLLFEGTIEANLPAGSSADFQLPVATAQIFLNDYMEMQAGIFDQPFGDWYEDQSPFWVNRFVTTPLPYDVEALVPPTDLGIQFRGGAQWGDLGQDVDYTVWVSNGPSFDSGLPEPVVGQAVNGVNNIKINTNGQGYGARLRFYPFPLDSNLGRLELGASTLDGKWLNGNWYNAWGVDFAYLRGALQARGEFLADVPPDAQCKRRQPPGLVRSAWLFSQPDSDSLCARCGPELHPSAGTADPLFGSQPARDRTGRGFDRAGDRI